MPRYTDHDSLITDQAKQTPVIVTVADEDTVVSMTIRRGMIIKNLKDGKNWKLKNAIKEQPVSCRFSELTHAAGFDHILTPAI